jgi:hypothetical protein
MRRLILVTAKTDGHLADRLDLVEYLVAVLRADGVAEQPAELADVAPQ